MVNLEDEIWKDVVGYEDLFSVSNKGQLFSKRTKKILKQNPTGSGYNTCVTKLNGRKGVNLVLKLHREVAKAFIPNPNNLPVVNHKDGNKLNNDVENLEWVSVRDNVLHALSNELSTVEHLLEANLLNRKLSKDDVLFVRNNYKPYDKNLGTRGLARRFGVSHKTIQDVINKIRYCEVA